MRRFDRRCEGRDRSLSAIGQWCQGVARGNNRDGECGIKKKKNNIQTKKKRRKIGQRAHSPDTVFFRFARQPRSFVLNHFGRGATAGPHSQGCKGRGRAVSRIKSCATTGWVMDPPTQQTQGFLRTTLSRRGCAQLGKEARAEALRQFPERDRPPPAVAPSGLVRPR